ncbi:MAG: hypothetical protein OXE48_04875 [Gammaproteobacteria bacterium]|nr:hypothetical protein [Gammaproteobacteria bacterium]
MKIDLNPITVRDLVNSCHEDNASGQVRGYGDRLDIRPPFQREFVYDKKQAAAVIETVIAGFPLNVMYYRMCSRVQTHAGLGPGVAEGLPPPQPSGNNDSIIPVPVSHVSEPTYGEDARLLDRPCAPPFLPIVLESATTNAQSPSPNGTRPDSSRFLAVGYACGHNHRYCLDRHSERELEA